MPVRESYAHGTPSWTDLSTTDTAGARAFYGELFGWEFVANPVPEGGEYIMATLGGKSAAGLALQQPAQAEMGVPPMWNTYITVDDVEAAAAKAESAGGSVMMAPMEVMDAGHMAVVADPAGAVVCMWQANQHIGSEIVNEPGALTWNELMTSDLESSASFLKALFGLDTEEMPMDGGNVYTVLKLGDDMVGGMLPPPMEGIPNHWATYFHVADVDATLAKATELGGNVMVPAFDVPDTGRMAGIQDPQGAGFMIMQPEDRS